MARMMSAARSHLLHLPQFMPPARLTLMRWAPLAPAQMGHTNETRTTGLGTTLDTP